MYHPLAKLTIAVLAGLLMSYVILQGLLAFILVVLALLALAFTFFFTWEQKLIGLSLTVFFPLAVGHFGPVPDLMFVELAAPFLFVLFIMDILSSKRPFFPPRINPVFIAIGILIIWAAVSYIKRPVSAQNLFGASMKMSGLRSYYTMFVGVTTFFCSFWFFRLKQMRVERWLGILLFLALALGVARVAGHFIGFNIPLLGGRFLFIEAGRSNFFRIGGLSEVVTLGMPLLVARYYGRRWDAVGISIFVALLGLLFFSGGRAALFGVASSLIVYLLLIERRQIYPFIVAIVICAVLLNLLGLFIDIPDQLRRFFAIKGGFAQQDQFRQYTFMYYWEIFTRYPIFGKGIGYIENIAVSSSDIGEFISKQLMHGGHSAYMSILAIFGLGGLSYFLTILFGSIYHAYTIFKKNGSYDSDKKLALFAFLYLLILTVTLMTGWNGFDNMELWFIAGMVAGIRAREMNAHAYQ